MEEQKEGKIMLQKIDPYFEHIQKIPWDSEYVYDNIKGAAFLEFNEYLGYGKTPSQCVYGYYHHCADTAMDEHGVKKAVLIIAGMLFLLDHNVVDEELAYEAYRDISDLETGDYDYLIPKNDLPLIKTDMKIIMDYLDKHPELKEP